jgi:signal transduction histidine kinase
MNPDIVIAYLRAVAGSALRAVIAFAAIVAINVLLNPGLARDAGGHRQQILDWLARFTPWWPAFAIAVVATLLVLPWACFRYAQWRYKGLEATALLPAQRRELTLPIGRDDAFALAKRVMQDDLALYAVRADADTGTLSGRATPLRSRSIRFANHRGGAAIAGIPGGEGVAVVSDGRWPEWVLRALNGLRLGPPARRIRVTVVGDAGDMSTIGIDARMDTVLPSVDVLGCNRRHIESIAAAVTALAQPLIAQRREVQERAQLQRRLIDARLQVLRAQIEPHFLYNTLANVQYLIGVDPPAASAMVGALIGYLRQALPRMRDAHSTLGEELVLASAYLDILRIRMGSRLAVAIDSPPALADHPFPPMMLTSLVENAIKHGLEPKSGGGRIAIDARTDDNSLRVSVADDGVGLGGSAGGGSGIGLRNIRETLESLFGARAKLTVEPSAGGGVVATIEVPRAQARAHAAEAATAVDPASPA